MNQAIQNVQQAIDLAVLHHNAGRLSEAEAIYQQILLNDKNQPIALHLSGLIAHQKGDHESAVNLIGRAIYVNPKYFEAHMNLCVVLKALKRFDDVVQTYQKALIINPQSAAVNYELGIVLENSGKLEEAASAYKKATEINPKFIEAYNNLGNIHKKLGQFSDAEICYCQVLKINSNTAEVHANLGNTLIELGRADEAAVCFRQAIALKPEHIESHLGLGMALQSVRNLDDAIVAFEKAIAINPSNFHSYNHLGLCHVERGKIDNAIVQFQKALDINSAYLEAHVNLGNAYKDMENFEDAVCCYEKAIQINPGFEVAYRNLCEVYEKTNKINALREVVVKAKRNCEMGPRLALREAQLLKLEGNYSAARSLLELQDDIHGDAGFNAVKTKLLGDLCDRLDDPKTAYSYFVKSNDWSQKTLGQTSKNGEEYLKNIDGLASCFTTDWISSWQPLEMNNQFHEPVFLVGFPRSGTTLMETVLRCHRSLNVIGESAISGQALNAAKNMLDSYPDGLAALDKVQQATVRDVYLNGLNDQLGGSIPMGLVIDKMPFNLTEAGPIQRIFPNARFIFVQRHPCDCVLSCFMQNFEMNNATANFLSLQKAAHLYDKVMTLWSQYQGVLPLRVHTVRYESLVEAFDETLTPVLEFLDLEWDEGMRNYAEMAKQQKLIRTPSYNQVTQPLYTRARDRWRRYQSQMEPVLPILEPWIKEYGYDC